MKLYEVTQIEKKLVENPQVDYRYRRSMKGEHIIEAVANRSVVGIVYFVELPLRGPDAGKGEFIKVSPGSMVWVEPEWRRQGIARAMFKKAEEVIGKKILPSGNYTYLGKELMKGIGFDV